MALAIFFFDAMIGNSDRRVIKPNILVRGSEFRLIDHEMAFRDFDLFAPSDPPWKIGGINWLVTPGAHIFATQLCKTRRDIDFAPIRSAWEGLSDSQVEAYEYSVPTEWKDGNRLAAFGVERIKQCRDRIADCIIECRRALDA